MTYHYFFKQIYKMKVLPTRPLERTGSSEFIEACKEDNRNLVSQLLRESPYLVYQYDYVAHD